MLGSDVVLPPTCKHGGDCVSLSRLFPASWWVIPAQTLLASILIHQISHLSLTFSSLVCQEVPRSYVSLKELFHCSRGAVFLVLLTGWKHWVSDLKALFAHHRAQAACPKSSVQAVAVALEAALTAARGQLNGFESGSENTSNVQGRKYGE